MVDGAPATARRPLLDGVPEPSQNPGALLVWLAELRALPLLGQVPLDVELREAGDAWVPVVVAAPRSASARELARVAATLPTPRRRLAGRGLPLSVVTGSRASR